MLGLVEETPTQRNGVAFTEGTLPQRCRQSRGDEGGRRQIQGPASTGSCFHPRPQEERGGDVLGSWESCCCGDVSLTGALGRGLNHKPAAGESRGGAFLSLFPSPIGIPGCSLPMVWSSRRQRISSEKVSLQRMGGDYRGSREHQYTQLPIMA